MKVGVHLGLTDQFSAAFEERGSVVRERRHAGLRTGCAVDELRTGDAQTNVAGLSHAKMFQHGPVAGERLEKWIDGSRELLEVLLGVDDARVRAVMRMKLVGVMQEEFLGQFEKERIEDDARIGMALGREEGQIRWVSRRSERTWQERSWTALVPRVDD